MSLARTKDSKWSKAVKERDHGMCRWPGCSAVGSSSAHIFSRWQKSVRWNIDNGVFLCFHHHTNFDAMPKHAKEKDARVMVGDTKYNLSLIHI